MTERVTAKQFKAMRPDGAANKYGAEKVTVDGIRFDSKREANRWIYLKSLERDGKITDLRRQVPIHLFGRDGPLLTPAGRPMRYVADFRYVDLSDEATAGLTVFEDAKGHPTKDYLIKKAVAAAQGVEIVEV